MTRMPLHRMTTVAAMLALGTMAGCASLWAPSHKAAAPAPQAMAPTEPPVVSPALIKQVQSKLKDAGYDKTGSVDGVWGDRTRTAVERYQTDHNLKSSGQLDAATLQAMNISASQPNGDTSPAPQDNTANSAPVPPAPAPAPTRGTTGPNG